MVPTCLSLGYMECIQLWPQIPCFFYGKDFSLSLRKSCYFGFIAGFLVKCCQEDTPWEKQKNPHCKLESPSGTLHPLTMVIISFLPWMPTGLQREARFLWTRRECPKKSSLLRLRVGSHHVRPELCITKHFICKHFIFTRKYSKHGLGDTASDLTKSSTAVFSWRVATMASWGEWILSFLRKSSWLMRQTLLY